ncbi:hypothetical protein TSUD_97760 [Trifolium subterraneum]|uniref:RNA-directed DNA polymerase n=1 Tax=Trifolium subterraneum TaxID=3900 RepID=A0A2Z6NBW3_TRISU|nr:hypothetical protein TSUD_97760 [Trifolium subterraneum]
MRPNITNLLEEKVSANSLRDPPDRHEDNSKDQTQTKRTTEEIQIFQAEILERMERLETNSASKFDKLYAALDVLINQSPPKQTHGAGSSNRPPFQHYDTPDLDRLTIASVHLDKDVVPWYQMVQRTHPFTSWIEFTRALDLDFGPSVYDCPRATLFKLNQTGTVSEYYLQFTSLANRVYGLSNDALIDCFVSDLNDDIRRDVLIHTPISLVKAMSLAKVYEEKYSATEMQLRRDKGLCYWCDEKFSFTHKCPNRQLMLLHYDDTDEDQVFDVLTKSTKQTTNSPITNLPEHHLSLNAMKGNSNMGVLRFDGSVEHIGVQILIDGGSSNNFVQPRIAKFLKLPVEPGPQFKVLVGNGQVMTAEGVIQKLPLEIQGHKLEVPVFLLPVAGADVILGASWLATLGPHVADYASLTLKFFLKDKFVTLTGQPIPRTTPAQFHHFKRLVTTDSIAECFTVQHLFKAPSTLPSDRSHNHSIPLMEGAPPVKVKPYRYPHNQKEQIEVMIQEMLHQGIIQNNTSPFSSPIILVKKKDGTWRFCTDYRALNAITVKDCFPIPTVDELLDEMFGAKYFSKLDLRSGFGVAEIEYLGHVVTGQGLTGYYRRFIKSYAKIASPLTDLLKKEAFQWNEQAELAFQQLKTAVTTASVLALPNFKIPFILETDASGLGIEMLAIAEAIAKFRHYLLGHKFIIRTDQKSLRSLMEQSLQTSEQQEWLHKFLGYDFTIEYKPGKENMAADALSRVMTLTWCEPKCQFIEQIREALQNDPQMTDIMLKYALNKAPIQYSMRDGLLYWKQRLVIPRDNDLLHKVLFEFHTPPIGGHAGITRTLARIKSQFYWPDMKQYIVEYVQKCVVCQQAKTTNTSPAGLLQPLPIPSQVWEDIAMDFITGLPLSSGYTTIMVVVDRLTKYAHFIPMRSDYSSKSVVEAFMHNIVKLHSMPKSIVSDRDKVFTSAFWQQLFKLQGTSLAMSSAYNPQSDGQIEVLNKALELFLRCFTFNNPKSWSKALSWSEYWYNTAFQTNIALQEELMERDLILQQLKKNLERAQQYMKKQADKHRSNVSFQIGDLVLVAYKLKLPDTAKIHPVFHVSQLKPFKGDSQEQYLPLPLTMSENGPIMFPIAVLQARTILKGEDIVMRPNITNLLEEKVSANSLRDPPDRHEDNSVSGRKDVIGPRRSQRIRKTHTMWREYVK